MIETKFKCRNDRSVTIKISDEENFLAIIFDEYGNQLGELKFDEVDGCLKLVWAYLDQSDPAWCRQGIGREVLRNVKEYSDCTIVTSDNDGTVHDDGSHLTGDAPAFVARMREEGLIQPSSYVESIYDENNW